MKLEGKVAIVTGASRGIGKAIAVALAEEGADVVVAARTEEETGPLPGTIRKTADEIRALGLASPGHKDRCHQGGAGRGDGEKGPGGVGAHRYSGK